MVKTKRRSYFGLFAVSAAMALLGVVAGSSEAAAGNTTRVSVDSLGAEANDESSSISISADGRYVAFHSYASNLVEGDTNNALDVFVHDRTTGTTELVSVDSSGNQDTNANSQQPSISADGRYVTFLASGDSNLVPGDTNNSWDIFVHDRTTGTTKRVSVNSSGEQANDSSFSASISDDGHYVVFGSAATNLVAGDTNDTWDVFVHDLQTGTTERANVNDSGEQANGVSYGTSMSSDGRYVAFESSATNLVEGDTNASDDVFVHDRQTGTTERVSVNSSGTQAYLGAYDPSISSGGRYVVFTSWSKNLLAPGFWRESSEVFVHDRTLRTTEWVSKDSGQGQSDGDSWHADVSSDGRYVTFESDATDMVAGGDTNGSVDIFARDLQARTAERVSVARCATQANGESFGTSMSSDGRYVAFDSLASNLVADDTNDTWDVFVHDRQTVPTQPSDCIAPSTTATVTTSSGATYNPSTWTNQDVTVTLSAQDDESGSLIRDIRYSATGAGATSQQTVAAANLPATFTIDAEGTTTISYFATDNAGNVESPAKTMTINIDKSAPDTTITSGPTGNVSSTTASFSFSSSETDSTFECSLDSSAFAECTSPKIYSGLAEGSHTFEVRAIDKAGNTDASAASRTWTVAAAPETTITSGPSGDVKSTTASFSFSSSEAGSTFQCSRDGSAFASCTSPKGYSSLSQGNHTFRVRAIDKAASVDPSPASRSWFVDTVVPKGTIVINGGAASTSSRSVTLRLSASDPSPASGVASMRFRNGGTTTWSEWFDYSTSKSWTLSAGAGTKTVYVQYKDRAGNNSAAASDTIKFSP
jgi:hypothetical protein